MRYDFKEGKRHLSLTAETKLDRAELGLMAQILRKAGHRGLLSIEDSDGVRTLRLALCQVEDVCEFGGEYLRGKGVGE